MSDQEKPRVSGGQYSRRDMLRLGAAAASLTAASRYLYTHSPSTVRQSDVDAEYNRVYDEIKAAKEVAKNGQKLIILLGEDHYSSLSYLHKIIVGDIAHRLGITNVIRELPYIRSTGHFIEHGEFEDRYLDSVFNRTANKKIVSSLNQDTKTKLYKLAEIFRKQLSATDFSDRTYSIRQKEKWLDLAEEEFFQNFGFRPHPGDPKRYDWSKLGKELPDGVTREQYYQSFITDDEIKAMERKRDDSIVENGMVRFIDNFPDHAVAVYGSFHLPYFVQHTQNSKDKIILAYDIDNYSVSQLEDTPDVAPGAQKKRAEQIEELKKSQAISTLSLEGDVPNYEDATARMMEASIKHRKLKGEMDNETAELLMEALSVMRSDTDRYNNIPKGR